jgi:hypothetical protein
VTSVPGKSNLGTLKFDFDRAVLHSGQAVLVHTTLTSMAGQTATTDAASSEAATTDAGDRTASVDSGTRMTLDVSSRRD